MYATAAVTFVVCATHASTHGTKVSDVAACVTVRHLRLVMLSACLLDALTNNVFIFFGNTPSFNSGIQYGQRLFRICQINRQSGFSRRLMRCGLPLILMSHVQAHQARRDRWVMQRFTELSGAVQHLQQQAERTQQVEVELIRTKAQLVSILFLSFDQSSVACVWDSVNAVPRLCLEFSRYFQ